MAGGDPTRTEWLDAHGMAVLSREEARDLLAGQPLGRLAFCRDGVPVVVPVNHVVDAWDVAFRSTFGTKLFEATGRREVAFQADDYDPDGSGWSVLATGVLEHVTDRSVIDRLEGLSLDTWLESAREGRWVRMRIDSISGRRLRR